MRRLAGAQPLHRRLLDELAGAHHAHARAHVRDHREVVAHEDVGEVAADAQVGEQVQDLRLDGDVERGGGLVQQDHRGLGEERARDRHALALPAR
jgi:hypothetical protein